MLECLGNYRSYLEGSQRVVAIGEEFRALWRLAMIGRIHNEHKPFSTKALWLDWPQAAAAKNGRFDPRGVSL